MTGVCKSCGKEHDYNNIRLGHCWDCVEAESIIDEGLDMRDNGLNGQETPAKSAMDKLALLIQKGWHK